MSKRLFQILDEMNVNDEVNKTATCGCCFDMVSANTVKAGGVVKMGVPAEAITKIFLGECKPMLVLLDMKEYHRLEKQPIIPNEAEARADRYEKALKEIYGHAGFVPHKHEMITIAREALTPKTSNDDTVNG